MFKELLTLELIATGKSMQLVAQVLTCQYWFMCHASHQY